MRTSDIEAYILGSIVFCNGYPEVAHILSDKHFSYSPQKADINTPHNVFNKQVFNAAKALFPHSPIDLITITAELKKMGLTHKDINQGMYESKIDAVNSAGNIKWWAFILIQENIKICFLDKLSTWHNKRKNDFDKMEAEVLKEIIFTLNTPENDVFEVIEKAKIYFKHIKMDFEFEESTVLTNYFEDKIKEIKRVNSITKALGYLIEVANTSGNEVQYNCHKFASAIADMITTGKTTDSYDKAVNVLMGYKDGI